MISKRKNYLSWEDYFMSIATLSSMRSKDPHTQVGACIVSKENKIVGIGYNGMPLGCDDDELPWNKVGLYSETKYAYVCHAELNAILNKNAKNVKKCRIYVDLFPCNECCKLIIQSGINEIIYKTIKNTEEHQHIAAIRMLQTAKVIYRQYLPNFLSISIQLGNKMED